MSRLFFPSYETDAGLIIQISFGYQNYIQERLEIGGFDDAETNREGDYGLVIPQAVFTPRYVKLKSFGYVYFKTFTKWFNFINSADLSDIINYQSESGTKVCISYFLSINRGDNG